VTAAAARGPVRLGVVGYGTGGRHFHAPFVQAADGIELAGFVTRSEQRRALLAHEWPGTPVYSSLGELLGSGVEAVTITTPPATRRELVLEAVAAGVHVVADKPFAPTAEVGAELAAAADAAGVLLSVFHNRRWDADVRTLAGVLDSGRLGELWRVHSRFDLDDPDTLEGGPEGGLLRDLGSHVVDQMLWLLGPVRAVSAHLDHVQRPEGRTDAGFVVQLRHASGVLSVVESSKLNRLSVRELRAYGSAGSYRGNAVDVQAQAIFSGRRPVDDPATWGYEPHRGVLATDRGERGVPSAQGRYHDFYTQFAAAVRGLGAPPVPAVEGVATLAVLDAARASAASQGAVELPDVLEP
jgi:predicted dehydrogenase